MPIFVDFDGTPAILSQVNGCFLWSCDDQMLEGVLNAYIRHTPIPESLVTDGVDIAHYAITKIKPGVIVNNPN